MCSKTCHLVNAPLITQVKTTALGALEPPPLFRLCRQNNRAPVLLVPRLIVPTHNALTSTVGDTTEQLDNRDIYM